jgi:hypothetical protein
MQFTFYTILNCPLIFHLPYEPYCGLIYVGQSYSSVGHQYTRVGQTVNPSFTYVGQNVRWLPLYVGQLSCVSSSCYTSLSLTTCWQIVELQDDNKLLEQLITSLLSSTNLVASWQQAVDNLSTSWEHAVRTHPVDKLLEQHRYKSAAGLLQLVCFYVYRFTCTHKNLTSCSKSANKLWKSVFALLVPSCQQVRNISLLNFTPEFYI